MLKTNIKRAFGTLFAANRVKYKKTTEMEEKKKVVQLTSNLANRSSKKKR